MNPIGTIIKSPGWRVTVVTGIVEWDYFYIYFNYGDLRPGSDNLLELWKCSSIFLVYVGAPHLLLQGLILQLSQHKNCFILKYSDTQPFIRQDGEGRASDSFVNMYYPEMLCLSDIGGRREVGGHMPVSSPLLGDSIVTGRYTKYFPTYFYNPDIFCLPFISFLFILRSHCRTRTSTECVMSHVTYRRKLMNDTSAVVREVVVVTSETDMFGCDAGWWLTSQQAGRWSLVLADILNHI